MGRYFLARDCGGDPDDACSDCVISLHHPGVRHAGSRQYVTLKDTLNKGGDIFRVGISPDFVLGISPDFVRLTARAEGNVGVWRGASHALGPQRNRLEHHPCVIDGSLSLYHRYDRIAHFRMPCANAKVIITTAGKGAWG